AIGCTDEAADALLQQIIPHDPPVPVLVRYPDDQTQIGEDQLFPRARLLACLKLRTQPSLLRRRQQLVSRQLAPEGISIHPAAPAELSRNTLELPFHPLDDFHLRRWLVRLHVKRPHSVDGLGKLGRPEKISVEAEAHHPA